jgi:hypothetical protein
MPKSQAKLLVGYCIFMLVMTQLLQHSPMHKDLIEPLAALFGSMLPIAISLFAIRNGWAMGRTSQFDRKESPVTFWLLVTLGFVVGGYLLIQGVWGLARLL